MSGRNITVYDGEHVGKKSVIDYLLELARNGSLAANNFSVRKILNS